MKYRLESLLSAAVSRLESEGLAFAGEAVPVRVERVREAQHGDFSTNLAMALAKQGGVNPRMLAERIIAALPANDLYTRVEIAGPGFINFFVGSGRQLQLIGQVLDAGKQYGLSQIGAGKSVLIEYVSANPTGPLHVGHGRGAAYGSVVANLLNAAGFRVHREYYVNDAGRQMDILAASVWLRYLQDSGAGFVFPSNGYRGEYVRDIAADLKARYADRFVYPLAQAVAGLPRDEPQGGDKEAHIDAWVALAKITLGTEDYRLLFDAGLNSILADIRDDLAEFGVEYQTWFSERSLVDEGAVTEALNRLEASGYLYEQDGARWFASSRLGDEKDRVVVRENGQMTYFAADIAYHMNKLDRQFDHIINIWGADHHGYIPRVRAALEAMGGDPAKLEVLLVQFAVLYRGEERVQMSTRSGEFVTLRQLRNEVGKDAARFFYVMRKADQHMDFDLKLATSRTNENPVYYVQYAHARICSVFRQLDEKGWARDIALGMASLERLTETHESALITLLESYPERLEAAALQKAPHHLINYLRELAAALHTYYNAHQFLVEDAALREARLLLIAAVRQVIVNGLDLLDIAAPESM
ncbi:arginine--tRNA ligase [Candidatus Methylospira mobilis]|uniref:Arginine--tRNA ligase n=1 Tax=Candidatus Methylospira mobilis TaxID=1808979 RepID=A0A5Q0BE33_9GAMM|nr:arginine--tRNA ligase [Candidatus Methylospira mobilis]QFY42115.1 arginine--tRNA ligase [Candidatus Methylospira mobilis]